MALLNNSVIKRLGIFCFYDKNGHAARFLDGFLAALTQNLTDLVIIVNGKIDDETRKLFSKYTDTVMVRENKGLDVAAYKQALLTIGWEKLETYDEVLCLMIQSWDRFTHLTKCLEPCLTEMWISGVSQRMRARP